jgi:hypothetical protein
LGEGALRPFWEICHKVGAESSQKKQQNDEWVSACLTVAGIEKQLSYI